jgi:anaerobic magnesium-protoporphyrin IX monomethyl ester cyclase
LNDIKDMSESSEPMPQKPGITFITFSDEVALGVRTLHALLTHAGFPCRIVFFRSWRQFGDWPTESELQLLFELIEKEDSEVFGLSFRSLVFPLAKRITEEIRRRSPAMVVWGGTHPTLMPEECIATADVVCVGEGESAILELMQALDEGKDFSNIKNLWVKTEQGIKRNPIRPLIQDLDSLPWPILGDESKYTIMGEELIRGDPKFRTSGPVNYFIFGSRGCPFSCDFCCNSAFRRIYEGAGPYVRKRSPENIIAELSHARENLDIMYVGFRDEIFTLEKLWTMEVCQLYRERIKIPFACEVHPKTVDEDLAKAMGEAGLHTVIIGVQSGSERVRREIYNRHISNQEITKAARLLHEQKARVYYDFIFDNPYETRADLEEAFQLLLELPRPNRMWIFSLTFFPGTKITERALKDKIIRPEEVEGAAEKPVKPFHHQFRYALNQDHAFYSILFWLSQVKFSFRYLAFYSHRIHDMSHPIHVIPLAVLRRLERSEFLYRHPEWLHSLYRFFIIHLNRLRTPVRWTRLAAGLMRQGKFQELARRIRTRTALTL